MNTLTFGSLFAGIGGFDLGFERAGFECRWQVEIDDYATKILEKHWPKVHRERDIRECNAGNLERVDCIIGGFPCQDISYAGRGAGLAGERSGLFFEAVRLVRELQPRAVVLENVAALLTRGLDRVLGTLAEIGYDAQWHCIPAAAVGAPHIRDRVFIIATLADTKHNGLIATKGEYQANKQQQGRKKNRISLSNLREAVVDTHYQKMWPTPDANCGNRGASANPAAKKHHTGTQKQTTLNDAVKMFPTPTSRAWKDNGMSPAELNRNSETLAMVAGGQLNPEWVEALMGFPNGWTNIST